MGLFKRPPTLKSTTLLRTSSHRKLRHLLDSLYSLTPSQSLLLLPDGLTLTKALTHLDEKLLIYSSPSGTPLWFSFSDEDAPIPTSFALGLVPLFPTEKLITTSIHVLPNLISGADLFLAGIHKEIDAELQKGDLVGIRLLEGGRVVGVGRMMISGREVGGKEGGKAVEVLMVEGDWLWKLGSEGPTAEEEEPLTKEVATLAIAPPPPPPPSAPTLSPEAISEILLTALFCGLVTSPPAAGALPLSAASLYASHVLPFRPAEVVLREEGGQGECVVKNSGYKNVNKMFLDAKKKGVLRVKENKNEVVVVGIEGGHELLQKLPRYQTISQHNLKLQTPTETSSSNQLIIKDLLSPDKHIREFVKTELGLDLLPPTYSLPAPLLKQSLLTYIKTQKLSHEKDGKYLILNQKLSESFFPSPSPSPSPSTTTTTTGKSKLEFGQLQGNLISKEDLWNHLQEKLCLKFWSVAVGGGEEVVKKGQPTPLLITPKTVGKRTMTLISSYESWFPLLGITKVEDFCDELKIKASSSVSFGVGKNGRGEVGVQGQQEKLVIKLLEGKGLPGRFVAVDYSKLKK